METTNNELPQKAVKTLAGIMSDHFAMHDLLSETDGELDLTTEQWLEENKENLGKKADGYKSAMDILENAEEFLKEKAKPFLEAAKVCANKRESLKERLKFAMKVLELKQIEGQDYVFTLSNGGQKLVVESENEIPASFFKEEVLVTLQKDLVKQTLESGEEVRGARLEQIQTLRVKINATTIKPKKVKAAKNAEPSSNN